MISNALKLKCVTYVPGEGRFGSMHRHQCTRNALAGKQHCKQHDPERIANKNLELRQANRGKRNKQLELQSLFPERLRPIVEFHPLLLGRYRLQFELNETEMMQLSNTIKSGEAALRPFRESQELRLQRPGKPCKFCNNEIPGGIKTAHCHKFISRRHNF